MKKSIYILSILSLGLFSCASQKKLQSESPFKTGEASYQHWTPANGESKKATLLKIALSQKPTGSVIIKQVFFRGKIADVSIESHSGSTFAMAKFENYALQKADIIVHGDPKMEVGNRPPKKENKKETDFSFELAPNEAVISYMEKNKLKYTKITGIKDKTSLDDK